MAAVKGDPRNTRAYKARRLAVLNRDGWVCYYCGGDATQADHVIPISKQGDPMDLDNMVACCKRCNVVKGNKSQGAFLALRSAPPVFSGHPSPMLTLVQEDSPFKTRPNQAHG
jgi:5-methylcytosine-specific restriction endonuclease McrA